MELSDLQGAAKRESGRAMSSRELGRFLDFVTKLELETGTCLDLRATTREMGIMIQMMRSHLEGRIETPSSLIAASGLSRGTAHRIVEDMIGRGLIARRPRTKSGKTFSLHPSEQLIENWLEYAQRMKSVIGTAFGLSTGSDYFFGGSYLSASIIPPLPVMENRLPLSGGLRILMHADPTFLAMQKLKRQFEVHFGVHIDGRALSLDRLHREIIADSGRANSRYDIVTCDLCWMAEFISNGIVQPVGEANPGNGSGILDFHPEALASASRGGTLYGLPVQTTPELLIYRKDLLAEKDVSPPATIDETLEAARRLHAPEHDISGIAWNGARGTPVGTTFAMVMADFGRPILNLPKVSGGYSSEQLRSEHYRPALDTEEALLAAEYLIELLPFSPPDVLQMSWFERARCYAAGQVAMSYCYTQITPLFEQDPSSPAMGQTGYLPHPCKAGLSPIAPLGGWNLCIPSNLRPDRMGAVSQAVQTLTSAAATKLYVENGSVVSSRFSVSNDPNVAEIRPIIPIVDRLAREGALQSWPRPAVPELNEVIGILGAEIHTMLQRNKNPRVALRDAQARVDALMRANGRY